MLGARAIFPNYPQRGAPQQGRAVPSEGSGFKPDAFRSGENALVHQFPEASALTASVRSVLWPGTGAVNIPAGQDGWFGVASWVAGKDAKQGALVGIRSLIGPTNSDQATYPDPEIPALNGLPFGTAQGYGAAFVIGFDLPCQEGVWTGGPANVPLVPAGAGGSTVTTKSADQPRTVHHFAVGAAGSSPQAVNATLVQTSPLCWRFTNGRRLDIALVIRRSYLVAFGAVAKTAPMRAHFELSLAALDQPSNFVQ